MRSDIQENFFGADAGKMAREPIMRTEKLCYTYADGNHALSQIDFTIYRGERLAVLGANGAGKSTLFFLLNGVYEPEKGKIFFQGKEITKKERNLLRNKVGIVFQDADHQMIASTVFSEVAFGPVNQKLPKEEVKKRTNRAMSEMNLEGFGDRAPHYLSGGEKKRVSIADILAMEPEIFVFDEPTTALDPENVQILEELFRRLHDRGKTVVASTHDVDFAYRFADRAVVLDHGNIAAQGTCTEVFARTDLLKSAHLAKPLLLTTYEILKENGLCPADGQPPRTPDELRKIIGKKLENEEVFKK